MRRVIIEFPFESDNEELVRYAHDCGDDSLLRGEAPFSARMFYQGVIDAQDGGEALEQLANAAALGWLRAADALVVYVDYGVCPKMRIAMGKAEDAGVRIEVRSLQHPDPHLPRFDLAVT